jgi:hypothetical protein
MQICWLYRTIASFRLDSGKPLPSRIENHLGHCPSCQRFYTGHQRIVKTLVQTAGQAHPEPSPFLHARIMRSIEESHRPQRASGMWWKWGIGLAGLAGLLLVLIVLQHNGGDPEPPATMAGSSRPDSPRVASEEPEGEPMPAQVPLINPESLVALGRMLDQPLENELQLVVHDARTALRGLAQTFIPERVLGTTLDPDSP